MELENKVMSRAINDCLYESGLTLSTAESCTGGRIAESVMATPGSSAYFKGGVVAYTDEIKERILGVDHQIIESHTSVSEEVAKEMVKGVMKTMQTDFAIVSTGYAGPGGGTPETPVGTIWIACGDKDEIITQKLTQDFGRDINIAIATSKAMQMFVPFLKRKLKK